MTRVWNHLAGVSLAGLYRLEEFLGGDESAAWYVTTSRSGQRAAIKLIPEESVDAGTQLGAWRAVRLLSHTNLLPMFDCGRAETDGCVFLYAVFEYPDDNLASALQRGKLDESEAQETLAAGLEALRYIHSHGMVHGAVDASNVLAVAERIKLSSDTLMPATSASIIPEDDVRALHRLLGIPYAADLAPIPSPALPAPALPPPAAPTRSLSPAVPEPEDLPSWRRLPAWAYGAAVGLVVAVVLGFALKPSGTSKSPSPAVPAPAAASPVTAPPAGSPAPAPAVAPENADPPAVPAPQRAEQAEEMKPAEGRAIWRVVAYTYNRYRDAEKRVRSINGKWPGLHAAVFTPRGRNRPPYFVSLGGRMTHAEALNLRHVARAKGLPRDTFVRNYSD